MRGGESSSSTRFPSFGVPFSESVTSVNSAINNSVHTCFADSIRVPSKWGQCRKILFTTKWCKMVQKSHSNYITQNETLGDFFSSTVQFLLMQWQNQCDTEWCHAPRDVSVSIPRKIVHLLLAWQIYNPPKSYTHHMGLCSATELDLINFVIAERETGICSLHTGDR